MKTKLLFLSLFIALSSWAQIPEIIWQQCHNVTIADKTQSICETENGYLLTLEAYDPHSVPGFHGFFEVVICNIDTTGIIVWEKCFGGSKTDKPHKMLRAGSNEYYIIGLTNSIDGDVQSGNQGQKDIWVFKINSEGELLWEKTYGGPGTDEAKDIILMPDGGFIIAGSINEAGGDIGACYGGKDIWLFHCDNEGNIMWEKTIGTQGDDECNSMIINGNGNLVLVGSYLEPDRRQENAGGEPADVWVAEIDMQGNILWQQSYGGSKEDVAYQIEDVNDGYIILAKTYSKDGDVTDSHPSQFGGDIWIVRIDDQGNIIWQKCLGGKREEYPAYITQTESGDFIILGDTGSDDGDVSGNHTIPIGGGHDIWMVKLSSEGQIEWQQYYGGMKNDYFQKTNTVIKKSDYHYVLAAQSNSGDSDDVNCGQTDLRNWLVEVVRCPDYIPGTPAVPAGLDTVCTTNNQECIFTIAPPANAWTFEWELEPDTAGIISGSGLQASVSWSADFEGTARVSVRSSNDCGDSEWSQPHYTQVYTCLGVNELQTEAFTLKVYPNPASDWAAFNYNLPDNDTEGTIKITDVAGKLIETLHVTGEQGQKLWDTRKVKPGMYFYTLTQLENFHQ